MADPTVFQEKTTYGDQYHLECPYCGKDITDLWDSDIKPMTSNVRCDHCNRDVDINIEFTCEITAWSKEGKEPVDISNDPVAVKKVLAEWAKSPEGLVANDIQIEKG